jgi:hypothetical protein
MKKVKELLSEWASRVLFLDLDHFSIRERQSKPV